VSKERARRRAERLVVLEKEKAVRARRVARRDRLRALRRRLKPPRRNRSGRLYHRSLRQRIGIAVVTLLAAAAVWVLIPDLALRIILTALLVLAVPALVVVVLGRRA
jgi:Flp pilus assembly protein TadB